MLFTDGCDRERGALTGDYSYKLSGEVVLTNADGEVTYRLIHRNGQMNILKDKSQKSRYIITMNEMSGGCYTMTAELRGDSLLIDQHTFQGGADQRHEAGNGHREGFRFVISF